MYRMSCRNSGGLNGGGMFLDRRAWYLLSVSYTHLIWKKLEELNKLYEAAISAERTRYDVLLREHTKNCNALIRKYKQQLAELISEKNKQNTESGRKEQG